MGAIGEMEEIGKKVLPRFLQPPDILLFLRRRVMGNFDVYLLPNLALVIPHHHTAKDIEVFVQCTD